MSPKVILYTSSVSFAASTRNHTDNLKYILESKGVEYETVDLSQNRERAEEMVQVSGGERKLPQLHVDEKVRVRRGFLNPERRPPRRSLTQPISNSFSRSARAVLRRLGQRSGAGRSRRA